MKRSAHGSKRGATGKRKTVDPDERLIQEGRGYQSVNCILCNLPLRAEKGIGETDTIGVVYDGVVCRTFGNYGSSVYDPHMVTYAEHLEFYICDGCILKRLPDIKHVHYARGHSVPVSSKSFNPKEKVDW